MADDLADNEVEVLARHTVSASDLRLGFAAQTAAEDAVNYKVARLLQVEGAELVGPITYTWTCVAVAKGKRRSVNAVQTPPRLVSLPPAEPTCSICGAPATTIQQVPRDGYGDMTFDDPRCHVHA